MMDQWDFFFQISNLQVWLEENIPTLKTWTLIEGVGS